MFVPVAANNSKDSNNKSKSSDKTKKRVNKKKRAAGTKRIKVVTKVVHKGEIVGYCEPEYRAGICTTLFYHGLEPKLSSLSDSSKTYMKALMKKPPKGAEILEPPM